MRAFIITVISISVFGTSCVKECECSDKPEQKTLTTQPGPNDGQDCLIAFRIGDGGVYANANHNLNPDIYAGHWTFASQGHGEGSGRSYLKFPQLSTIPQNATVKSAKLSLYGINTGAAAPQGNSYYPGSPYEGYGDNKTWLKRVTEDWTETTITWNNKPATTDINQIELPASTSQWNFNVTDIDVTNIVKDMVANSQNYGFCLQLQVEQIYRSLSFASSEAENAALRPKLVVEYEVE